MTEKSLWMKNAKSFTGKKLETTKIQNEFYKK